MNDKTKNHERKRIQMKNKTQTIDYLDPNDIMKHYEDDRLSTVIVNLIDTEIFDDLKKNPQNDTKDLTMKTYQELFNKYFKSNEEYIRDYIKSDKCPTCMYDDISLFDELICNDLQVVQSDYECNTCREDFRVTKDLVINHYEVFNDETEEYERV